METTTKKFFIVYHEADTGIEGEWDFNVFRSLSSAQADMNHHPKTKLHGPCTSLEAAKFMNSF